jgi:hypothetical protein
MSKVLQDEFKKRYNRDVTISCRAEKDGKIRKSIVQVLSSNGKEYTLIDSMKEGMTIEANLLVDDKKYVYKRYIDAEVHLADLLGEE